MSAAALLSSVQRDVRYGVRMLRHNPMFTAVALLTLAIGIGANSAVFSVVNSVLIKPLAYPHSEELVALHQLAPGAAGLANVADGLLLSPSMYFTYLEQNRTFQSMGVWIQGGATVSGLTEPERVRTAAVSDGLLQTLGVRPSLGRWFSSPDQLPGSRQTVILSYGYWQARFGGNQSAIGSTLMVDSLPREIVGVMPEGFRIVDADFDLVLPLAFDRSRAVLPGFGFQGIARLRPGETIEQANADLARLLPVWMDSWPFFQPGSGIPNPNIRLNPRIYETWRITPALRPLKQQVVGSIGSILWVVMGTIGVVMLIACANVANLVLVRSEARQKELSIRVALGAGRGRIARELLVESVLLGLIGGAFGIVLADQGLRLLASMGPTSLPRLSEITLDARAIVFTLALSVLSGLLFGLIPAVKYAGSGFSLGLRSSGRTSSGSRERHRATNLLVVAQVAMALVLLMSAGLMIRTFQALRNVDTGLAQPEHLQTMRIAITPSISDPEEITRLDNRIVSGLAAIPGVTSAAFASAMPMEGFGFNWDAIRAEDRTYSPGDIPPLRMFKYISPGFFNAAGIPLLAGRELTWADIYEHKPVAMISENLAREMWGAPTTALGKRFRYILNSPPREVIGVIKDVRENGVQAPAPAIVYWPSMTTDMFGPGPLNATHAGTFIVRSSRTGTESFLNEIRQAVWAVDSSLPVTAPRSMQQIEVASQSMARASFTLVMLAIAAVMALILGIIGIYGVISYAVSQRRREIGIRLALGAQPGQLRRMFVNQGLMLTAAGLTIGAGVAAALTRLMTTLLFGVKASDPATFIAVATLLGIAAITASYVPARRASAVDPIETLGGE
jgi:predicted permease